MPFVFHNIDGKIWFFISQGWESTVPSNSEQQLSLMLKNQVIDLNFLTTIVYAKCDRSGKVKVQD